MKIIYTLKQIGKKRPILEENEMEIDFNGQYISLKDLLLKVVESEVNRFNTKILNQTDENPIPNKDYLMLLNHTGKVGFNNSYNTNLEDLQRAQENVINGFDDGIFVVFYGDNQLEKLDESIDLFSKNKFIFIRLTFLAGSIW